MFLAIEELYGCELPLSLLVARPTIRALAGAIREGAGAVPCLIPIQAGGTRPPLFCVHDLSGNVLVYRRLAGHLGPDQPVYGFQYPDQHQQPLPVLSIEQLAARYVDELLAARPEGPYLLAGYSVGGAIAYEMARRLDARRARDRAARELRWRHARLPAGRARQVPRPCARVPAPQPVDLGRLRQAAGGLSARAARGGR